MYTKKQNIICSCLLVLEPINLVFFVCCAAIVHCTTNDFIFFWYTLLAICKFYMYVRVHFFILMSYDKSSWLLQLLIAHLQIALYRTLTSPRLLCTVVEPFSGTIVNENNNGN